MAQIVAGFNTPHNPFLPIQVAERSKLVDVDGFRTVADALVSAKADVVVAFSPDHLNTFFYDNLPSLAIGIVDQFTGPNDSPPVLGLRTVRSDPELAGHLYRSGLSDGFDLARTHDLEVDHALMVPLHLLAPDEDLVIVPIIMNVLAPPILPAWRARAFGHMIGAAIRSYPRDIRVALLANGGINQEVAGPRSAKGMLSGAPDREWHDHVMHRLRLGEIDELTVEATNERLERAGNAAGELLTVLAMLSALGRVTTPAVLIPEPEVGHCFSVWIATE